MNLSLAGQDRLDAATVDASSQPPSSVWQSIATSDRFERHLIESVRGLLADTQYYDWVPTLRDGGVTAHEGRYAQLIAWLDRPPEHDYHQDALEYTAALGQGQAPTYSTLDALLKSDIADGPLAILQAADCTPTIAAHLDKTEFAEPPRQQREDTLKLLSILATQCDVHLICTGRTARWLEDNHRSTDAFNRKTGVRHGFNPFGGFNTGQGVTFRYQERIHPPLTDLVRRKRGASIRPQAWSLHSSCAPLISISPQAEPSLRSRGEP